MSFIYLDHAATTPVHPNVVKEMLPYFTQSFGNASSRYHLGHQSFSALEIARTQLANVLHCDPCEIVFTSGGTESDNLALFGAAHAYQTLGKHIITTKIEHPAVKLSCAALEAEGFSVTYLPVSKDGSVSPCDVEKAIRPETILISVMFANNELGTIQPISEIGKIARQHDVLFHTDAVQAFCNVPIDVQAMQIDLLSLSGHKIYGPKGVGALYIRSGTSLHPILHGGQQENGQRAGTENVPAIVGLGYAAQYMGENLSTRTASVNDLRNYFEAQLSIMFPELIQNGSLGHRLPGHSNLTFPNVRAKQLMNHLNYHGIFASIGSACSCLTNSHSHVLRAIGKTDSEIESTIRFSLGYENSYADIDKAIQIIASEINNCRR